MTTNLSVTELKPYSTKELALFYDVCDKTLKKWIKPFETEIGTRHGRYYNVAQVKLIFERLGVPASMS